MACQDFANAAMKQPSCLQMSCEALHESALEQARKKCHPFKEINILERRKMENSSVGKLKLWEVCLGGMSV